LSAEVWNYCVGIDKEIKKTNNYNLTRSDLQKLTKGIVPLHSKNIQHVVHAYIEARDAMWKSIKTKHENSNKVKLPYKNKKYFTSGWDYQSIKVNYEKGIIKLSKPKITNKQPKPVKCYAKTIPKNIVEIELVYKHKLMFVIKYKVEDIYKKINSDNKASIDLGEIHSITSIDNNGNAIIITGRKIRSDKRLRNKEQGKIRKRMAKCTKGSKQYKKYRKALNNLSKKFERKELDSIHKITKLYVDYCIQKDISTVYYGDLDSCTRNTKKRTGKILGQKLNEWNYGLLIKQLETEQQLLLQVKEEVIGFVLEVSYLGEVAEKDIIVKLSEILDGWISDINISDGTIKIAATGLEEIDAYQLTEILTISANVELELLSLKVDTVTENNLIIK